MLVWIGPHERVVQDQRELFEPIAVVGIVPDDRIVGLIDAETVDHIIIGGNSGDLEDADRWLTARRIVGQEAS